ncbi:hypothetical protein FOQG_17008 [Fusarium oxysporum f. sp. raphani 54005]|uniref:Uncharacterized protein n=1 Tax=Fusarium oxysporum f. sp. raphani 54005 TaxID=1089458 RepID=X0BHI2_FUSOX|nr:hypothetical protein FOQG_17008 [Fusarium oxysporum f. sp. raphani 54005]
MMESQVMNRSPDHHGHQLGDGPGRTAGTHDKQPCRRTDHDISTSHRASEEEMNTVVEFQATVMNSFIADPAAWLRRERSYLKIDNSKRRLHEGQIASDASFGALSSDHTFASRLSSEDQRTEDADGNPISPAYTSSEPETCALLESRLTAERGNHYLALDDAASCLRMGYQEGELLKDLTRKQQVAGDCQERAFRYHSCEAHMGGCLERVNKKWLCVGRREGNHTSGIIRDYHFSKGS